MKMRLLTSVAAILLLPGLAQAQQHDEQQRGQQPQHEGQRPGGGAARPQPQQHPAGGQAQRGNQARPVANPGSQTGHDQHQAQAGRPQPVVQAQRQERSYQGQRAGGINNGGGRSFHPQQAGRYRYPNGYSYQRWSVGLMLPSIFWGSSNYYNDYDAIGVGPPPSGYRWVRYGPDLLLINRRTGRIARVIHGAFY